MYLDVSYPWSFIVVNIWRATVENQRAPTQCVIFSLQNWFEICYSVVWTTNVNTGWTISWTKLTERSMLLLPHHLAPSLVFCDRRVRRATPPCKAAAWHNYGSASSISGYTGIVASYCSILLKPALVLMRRGCRHAACLLAHTHALRTRST